MFDSIVLKNAPSYGPLVDVGVLAECLLFYKRVVIVGNTGTLKDLLAKIQPFLLLSLLRDKRIEFYYLSEQLGVQTSGARHSRKLHALIRFSSPDHTIEKVGSRTFQAALAKPSLAQIRANEFATLLQPFNYARFDQKSVLQALSNHNVIEAAVASLIRVAVPTYENSEPIRFRIEPQNKGFHIDTNIDFVKLNKSYHRIVPSTHSSMSEEYVLALLQKAYEATYLAATLDSEVAVTPIEQVIQERMVEAVIARRKQSELQIEKFVDLTLSNAHTIREAVNSGAVRFTDVIKLLDSADKFRHWLESQPPNVDLLREFYQSTITDTWVERLPTKSARWSVFTGLGFAIDTLGGGGLGTVAGVALSAIDSFLIDKLVKGWKPHQFVEGSLKPLFVNNTKQRKRKRGRGFDV
ncbi:MAG TPA: hypothetical protein V6D10_05735 [Trichocoleus sp.]|jgi:hypothetical protein